MPDRRPYGRRYPGPGPRGQSWDDFGRRMFPRFLTFIAVVALGLVGLGALLAVLLGNFEISIVAGAIILTPLVLITLAAVVAAFA